MMSENVATHDENTQLSVSLGVDMSIKPDRIEEAPADSERALLGHNMWYIS
jgi:hypothetical protein